MTYAALLSEGVDFEDAGFMGRLETLHRQRSDLDYATVPLILLGAGSVMAQSFVRYAIERLNVVAVVDNARAGDTLYGHPVIGDAGLTALLQTMPEAVGIICAGSEKPAKHFEALFSAHPQALLFYFEVMPYLGETFSGNSMFNELLTFANRAQVADIHRFGRTVFTDAESLKTLDALMIYRLTWDNQVLAGVQRPSGGIYLDSDICRLGPEEILVDGGAYDGDTVRSFVAHTGHKYRHIHAFELDPVNFEALTTKTAHLADITCYPAGLWSHADTVAFQTTGAMGSRIDMAGTAQLKVDALDNFALGEVSYIKLDIEGAEGAAIDGMRHTIERYKPKLALSAYHKADDMIRLIEQVRAMRPDYRFELRHYSSMIWDTVIYAV